MPGNYIEITEAEHANITEAVRTGKIKTISKEEGYVHILRGLISYHERMTMGTLPEKDCYLDALKFALACVEEKDPRHDT